MWSQTNTIFYTHKQSMKNPIPKWHLKIKIKVVFRNTQLFGPLHQSFWCLCECNMIAVETASVTFDHDYPHYQGLWSLLAVAPTLLIGQTLHYTEHKWLHSTNSTFLYITSVHVSVSVPCLCHCFMHWDGIAKFKSWWKQRTEKACKLTRIWETKQDCPNGLRIT